MGALGGICTDTDMQNLRYVPIAQTAKRPRNMYSLKADAPWSKARMQETCGRDITPDNFLCTGADKWDKGVSRPSLQCKSKNSHLP